MIIALLPPLAFPTDSWSSGGRRFIAVMMNSSAPAPLFIAIRLSLAVISSLLGVAHREFLGNNSQLLG